jgi:hypothetical protein
MKPSVLRLDLGAVLVGDMNQRFDLVNAPQRAWSASTIPVKRSSFSYVVIQPHSNENGAATIDSYML